MYDSGNGIMREDEERETLDLEGMKRRLEIAESILIDNSIWSDHEIQAMIGDFETLIRYAEG